MARFVTTQNIRRGFDLEGGLDDALGGMVRDASGRATYGWGGLQVVLAGSYTLDPAGRASGTVTQVTVLGRVRVDGELTRLPIAQISNFTADAADLVADLRQATGQTLADALFAGNDSMVGSGWRDHLLGLAGNDTLVGGGGADSLNGGGGRDHLLGGAGADLVLGGDGNDQLQGDYGRDTLTGGAGNDYLLGGLQDDLLEGGAGADRHRGGEGADVFIFRGSHGPDVVGDFTLDDLLVLGPEYWAGHLTAGELLEDHATQMMNGVMLQTGTNSIFILGWEDIDTLGGRLRSVDQLL